MLPYTPYSPHQPNLHPPQQQQQQQLPSLEQGPHESHSGQEQQHQHHAPIQSQNRQPIPAAVRSHYGNAEEEWRDHCLRGILSYPPGTQRLLVMDAMRVELVQQLGQYLRKVDSALHRIREFTFGNRSKGTQTIDTDATVPAHLDTDMEIVRKFEQGILTTDPEEEETQKNTTQPTVRVISKHSLQQQQHMIHATKQSQRQIRECLPQLVSAVLKSPQPFNPNLVDPVHKLRELIISRCQQDPSWGIELCWLLEAEVGRTWKSLFEHRQQTGKRLIVVLPADKAAVLAKIGTEKREAFDLLQDAERVTAYGYSAEEDTGHHVGHGMAKLPSSISLLRCSHFGDTMHFIDRLTKISLDLRMVPAIQRHVRTEASVFCREDTHVNQLLPMF